VKISEAATAQTGCIRFKVTEPPFDDIRVRRAIVLCPGNAQNLEVSHRGLGVLDENHLYHASGRGHSAVRLNLAWFPGT